MCCIRILRLEYGVQARGKAAAAHLDETGAVESSGELNLTHQRLKLLRRPAAATQAICQTGQALDRNPPTPPDRLKHAAKAPSALSYHTSLGHASLLHCNDMQPLLGCRIAMFWGIFPKTGVSSCKAEQILSLTHPAELGLQLS